MEEYPNPIVVQQRVLSEGETISDAARGLLPELAAQNLRAAQAVISNILRSVLSRAEYRELAERNRTIGGKKGAYTFHPDGFVAPLRRSSRRKKKPHWLPEEADALRKILADQSSTYRYSGGLHEGALSYSLIAQVLNQGFKGRRPRRSPNSVFRFAQRLLKQDAGTENLEQ